LLLEKKRLREGEKKGGKATEADTKKVKGRLFFTCEDQGSRYLPDDENEWGEKEGGAGRRRGKKKKKRGVDRQDLSPAGERKPLSPQGGGLKFW